MITNSITYEFDYKSLPQEPGVYCIVGDTGKQYIGSCGNFYKRVRRHLSYLRRDAHHCEKLQNAYNKYGRSFFKFKILENTLDLEEREQYYVDQFRPDLYGYNIQKKVRGYKSFKLSEEAIRKAIDWRKLKVVQLTLEGELIEIHNSVSEAAVKTGSSSSNISRCCRGVFRSMVKSLWLYERDYDSNKKYCYTPYVRCLTEEQKNRIRLSHLGIKHSPERTLKKAISQGFIVCKYDLNNNLLEEYFAVNEAGRKNDVNGSSIRRSIHNDKPCKGFMYRYKKM